MVDLNEESINLRVLKKIDDNIREIIRNHGPVAVYYFDVTKDCWKRKNIEGALFFVKRSVQPEYAFVVLNRLNTNNFVEKITDDFAVKLQSPYLMYKNKENEINCIWCYDKDQLVSLNNEIQAIVQQMKSKKNNSSSLSTTSTVGGVPMHILTNNNSTNDNQNQLNGLNSKNMVYSKMLKDLLSIKKDGLISSNDNSNEQSLFDDSIIMSTLPQPGLIDNNDQKQPNKQITPVKSSPSGPLLATQNVQSDLFKPIAQKRSLNLKELFESNLTIKEGSPITTNAQSNMNEGDEWFGKQIYKSPPKKTIDNDLKNQTFMTDDNKKQNLATHSLISEFDLTLRNNNNNANIQTIEKEPNEVQEMKNIIEKVRNISAKQTSTIPNLSTLLASNELVTSGVSQSTPKSTKTTPTPPMTVTTPKANADNPMYLSMEQLKQTLIYLLKNDADFLHTIHTTYVECIKKN